MFTDYAWWAAQQTCLAHADPATGLRHAEQLIDTLVDWPVPGSPGSVAPLRTWRRDYLASSAPAAPPTITDVITCSWRRSATERRGGDHSLMNTLASCPSTSLALASSRAVTEQRTSTSHSVRLERISRCLSLKWWTGTRASANRRIGSKAIALSSQTG